jgi:hypothetical protein
MDKKFLLSRPMVIVYTMILINIIIVTITINSNISLRLKKGILVDSIAKINETIAFKNDSLNAFKRLLKDCETENTKANQKSASWELKYYKQKNLGYEDCEDTIDSHNINSTPDDEQGSILAKRLGGLDQQRKTPK